MSTNYWIDDMGVATPSNQNFHLHAHDNYEILLFVKGDTRFIVEENVYNLKPYDVIVVKKNQLHRAFHNSPMHYHRIVLNILPTFFIENRCEEYENLFTSVTQDSGNKIEAEAVKRSGLYNVLMRIRDYSQNYQNSYTPVVRAGIIEFLFLLNKIKLQPEPPTRNMQLKEIIAYINNHFTEIFSLDDLAEKFFISKYYLCHTFHQETGLTVHQYLTKKRLLLAKELQTSDKTISEVAELVGFNSYSSFYRAYTNEFGMSPKYAPRNKTN